MTQLRAAEAQVRSKEAQLAEANEILAAARARLEEQTRAARDCAALVAGREQRIAELETSLDAARALSASFPSPPFPVSSAATSSAFAADNSEADANSEEDGRKQPPVSSSSAGSLKTYWKQFSPLEPLTEAEEQLVVAVGRTMDRERQLSASIRKLRGAPMVLWTSMRDTSMRIGAVRKDVKFGHKRSRVSELQSLHETLERLCKAAEDILARSTTEAISEDPIYTSKAPRPQRASTGF